MVEGRGMCSFWLQHENRPARPVRYYYHRMQMWSNSCCCFFSSGERELQWMEIDGSHHTIFSKNTEAVKLAELATFLKAKSKSRDNRTPRRTR
ncbi:hypothetical protein EVAR_16745_1 [Eumeta japonica]|uniref:Uncharacterized protein n=1 Tax=Eumeta variegata TaxID=151549 RepID=A0A4C1UKU7_EUMVA|nr:hypothetical protein EVAR_16745_1 [Eumeta japonica]